MTEHSVDTALPDATDTPPALSAHSQPVSFAEALRFWFRLGLISFGGLAGQIAIMHAGLVERRRWISEKRFLHALNFCMLLPGPDAQQLATPTRCFSQTLLLPQLR
jgi:chromate transporter